MTEVKAKQCPLHDNRVYFVCLFRGCDNTLLCRKCCRDHPEEHEAFVKDIHELQESQDWVQPYEKERDLLVAQWKEITTLKDQIVSNYKDRLEQIRNQIANRLEEHIDNLLEELNDLLETEQLSGKDKLFGTLEENLKILQDYNFRNGDDFDKVINVKEFNEKIEPSAKKILELWSKKLEECMFDEKKVEKYKEEIIAFIESVRARDVCPSGSFRSLKENDTLIALTDANNRLNKALEESQNHIEELKGQINELTQKNSQLNNDITIQAQDNIRFKDQVISLETKVDALTNTLAALETDVTILQEKKKQQQSLGWEWTQKSLLISLSDDSMTATKNFSKGWTGVFGIKQMFQGCYKWEIEVLCATNDKSGLIFGIIEYNSGCNPANFSYNSVIGLGLKGSTQNTIKKNQLQNYDNKVYLCSLDLELGTFTISHEGTVICKEKDDLRNKVFVPCAGLYYPGSYAQIRMFN